MSAERGVEGSFGTEMLKDTLCRHFRFVPVIGLEVFKEILWNTNEGGTAIIRPSCLVAGGRFLVQQGNYSQRTRKHKKNDDSCLHGRSIFLMRKGTRIESPPHI